MKAELERYIQDNLDLLDKNKPDPAILNRVLAQIKPVEQQANKTEPRGILIPFRLIKWAAACIIFIACGIGFFTWQSKRQKLQDTLAKKSVAQPQLPPVTVKTVQQDTVAIAHAGNDAVDNDLQDRKIKIVRAIQDKKLVSFAGFNNISSAADRINAVTATTRLANTRNEIVNGLVDVLNKDANSNVRLAALDGLARFYRDDYTRKKLLASLKKQNDPLVQIALIGLLTRMRESGIVAELEKMVEDQATEKTVKDCAYSSILQLHQ